MICTMCSPICLQSAFATTLCLPFGFHLPTVSQNLRRALPRPFGPCLLSLPLAPHLDSHHRCSWRLVAQCFMQGCYDVGDSPSFFFGVDAGLRGVLEKRAKPRKKKCAMGIESASSDEDELLASGPQPSASSSSSSSVVPPVAASPGSSPPAVAIPSLTQNIALEQAPWVKPPNIRFVGDLVMADGYEKPIGKSYTMSSNSIRWVCKLEGHTKCHIWLHNTKGKKRVYESLVGEWFHKSMIGVWPDGPRHLSEGQSMDTFFRQLKA
jgi:hypothetical protein